MYNTNSERESSWASVIAKGVGILVGILLLIFAIFGTYIVRAGDVGVITRFGAVERVVQPGFGFKVPFVEWVTSLSTRVQKVELLTGAASSDLQVIDASISVNYRLVGEKALLVYEEVGKKYEETVLVPAILQAFKATTAQYTAEESITVRDLLASDARDLLQEKMLPYHIIVTSFNIENIDFSEEYDRSIEAKQVQEQNVKIAALKQKEAEITAETLRIQAQGQADAQEILNDTGALSRSYLQYLFLTNWNGQLPSVIGGASPVFDIDNYVEP